MGGVMGKAAAARLGAGLGTQSDPKSKPAVVEAGTALNRN
ncbi:hypothetical protein Mnod_5225 [Methylobacterium nodulans ORS 2060]|uniref:Uncharacterized protein n=1 Tax=Methylobacterium nodulans (strain LMG 21967 / CNCM I-2342 / ORS 2060) TaxID=460265 RepID=B8IK58_METNO|nr:hypothetical protein Mnod_5225 [Methylobacterium nodulans ORS 2060]